MTAAGGKLELGPGELEPYLARIGLSKAPKPDHAGLVALHRAHLFAVPFENLDIHLGVPIDLDLARLVAKLVTRRRGGYCYELNGAFAGLLGSLGFRVRLLEARVFGPEGLGVRFDHLCLAVELDRPYLADVGFGECFQAPLELRAGAEQVDASGHYRLMPVDEDALDLERDGTKEYRLYRAPRALADFRAGCHHHQTAPDSHFLRRTLVSLPTTHGRITLSGRKWIESSSGERVERELAPAEWKDALGRRFGITLDAASLTRLTS